MVFSDLFCSVGEGREDSVRPMHRWRFRLQKWGPTFFAFQRRKGTVNLTLALTLRVHPNPYTLSNP